MSDSNALDTEVEATEVEKIEIELSWAVAMRVYIAALLGGTAEGKQAASEDLMRLAKLVDKNNATLRKENAKRNA
jgi:hypothetical protein